MLRPKVCGGSSGSDEAGCAHSQAFLAVFLWT